MDDADIASDREERFRALAIKEALRGKGPAILFEACRNCQEPLQGDRQTAGFCCVECRDDWTARELARRRQGLRFIGDE